MTHRTVTSFFSLSRQLSSLLKMPSNRGAFIVFEGVDRSGKTTQCRELAQSLRLNNIKCEVIRFPERTTQIGQLIDRYLREKECKMSDEAIHLLFTANRWELKEKMSDLLKSGVTLIVDRYSYSGIAYSSVKQSISEDWCKHPENGLVKPDLVYLLTINKDALSQRPGYGAERYENDETQTKVARVLREMSTSEDNWEVIDASGQLQEISDVIYKKTIQLIDECKEKPLCYLNFS